MHKKWHRVFTYLLTLTLSFSLLTACDKKEDDSNQNGKDQTTPDGILSTGEDNAKPDQEWEIS